MTYINQYIICFCVQDQPSSDSFYDSDNTEGDIATTSAVAGTSGHQRTTSESQNEDEHEEDMDGTFIRYYVNAYT